LFAIVVGGSPTIVEAVHAAQSTGVMPFKLLATAIAGRVVDVAPAARGAPTWSDGATVFVDAELRHREQLRCVAVQASLLGAGSLDADVVAALVRRPRLIPRFLAVEAHRALLLHDAVLPLAVRPLLDRETAARSGSALDSLAIAAGAAGLPDVPACFGTIHPRRVRVHGAPDVTAHTHVPRESREALQRELDDEQQDDDPTVDLFSSPIGGGGPIGRLLKKLLGDTRSPGASGPPGTDAPTHWGRRSTRVGRAAAVSRAVASIADVPAAFEQRSATYPEWDVHRGRYRLDWCAVTETEPDRDAPLMTGDVHALRRSLGRLGMDLERRRRQLQGDEIDVDAAVESRVQALAGSPPDEAVYIDTVRNRRDLAVLLLLDVSGSAGEASETGLPVHEHQRAAAASLAHVLHELGDRVAVFAFRSQGRSAVQLIPVKRFDGDFDEVVRRRLGGLVPGAYTRLGAAIRHGTAVLEREGGMSRRLLVVLSDGFAYDHGYEGAYGEADARRALAEARRRGMGCLCLSVGGGTDVDALARVFGTAAHASIPRAELLPAVVGPLFRAALRSAELQRRLFQRSERTRERLKIERETA
jgi:Mg-chelatase subunit ChlD